MLKIIIFLNLFSISVSAFDRIEICQRVKRPNHFQNLILTEENQIAFPNEGGFQKKGVCWWRALFQRDSTYLTIFRPELPHPTNSEAKALINDIIEKKAVVVIPGFSNLYEFTWMYRKYLQKALDTWQILDGISFGWVPAVTRPEELRPQQMAAMMDELYEIVEKKKQVAYQMLQLKGMSSHAWLVVAMEDLGDGYRMKIVDNNRKGFIEVEYKYGDKVINWYGVPVYNARNTLSHQAYKQAWQNFCLYGTTSNDLRDWDF